MMGYAEEPADFAMGRTVDELRTGDLARRSPRRLYEIVGRSNRFAKIFGLRIDLDRVERLFADEDLAVRAVSCDEHLALFVLADRFVHRVHARATSLFGLPMHAIRVHAIAEFPRTSSGKPDNAALVRHARTARARGIRRISPTMRRPRRSASLFAELLGRPDAALDDSFAGLGGDSLSYVEVSLRLEQLLGELPRQWPTMTAGDLSALAAPAAAPGGRRRRRHRFGRQRRPPRVGQRPSVASPRARPPLEARDATDAPARDPRGASSDRDRARGRHPRQPVRPDGRGAPAARGRRATTSPDSSSPMCAGRSRVGGLLKSTAQVVVPAGIWIGAVGLITGGYRRRRRCS